MALVECKRTCGLLVAIGFIVILLPTCSFAQVCPPYPEGVQEVAAREGTLFISVAKARALSAEPGSIEIAQAEARVEARRGLLIHPWLHGLGEHMLRGAMDIHVCVRAEDVYAVVKVSEESIQQALTLQDAVSNSLRQSPTPSSSFTSQGTEGEFERLMKKHD